MINTADSRQNLSEILENLCDENIILRSAPLPFRMYHSNSQSLKIDHKKY